MKTCKDCGAWYDSPKDAQPVGKSVGQCRLNPPRVFMASIESVTGPRPIPVTFWPMTENDAGCYRWEAGVLH